MSGIQAVDLFCGAGGLTAGLIRAKIEVKAGYDVAKQCAFAYEYNNPGAKFICKDVQSITGKEIEAHYTAGAIKLLAGCAPCQPFSTYTQGKDTRSDQRWSLLYAFSRLIREVNPELITMENVPDVVKHQVYKDFVKNLEEQGYEVKAQEVRCTSYGIPQSRRRHVLLASRIGEVALIAPTHENRPITVKEAIGDLPPLKAGEQSPTDPLHRSVKLNDINMRRIKASKPGGTWRDWPKSLRTKCHNKQSGKSYPSVYGRMEWNKPAPTMTTLCYGYGNGRFGHPEQDRAISLREAAIFQTFPEDYQFFDSKEKTLNTREVGQMIGNAVPVRLGEVVGLSLLNSLCSPNSDQQRQATPNKK